MHPASAKGMFNRAIHNSSSRTAEGRLGEAVLCQAMNDVVRGKGFNRSDGERTMSYHSGKDFLTTDNQALNFWCDVAGLEKEFVMRMAKLQIEHMEKKK